MQDFFTTFSPAMPELVLIAGLLLLGFKTIFKRVVDRSDGKNDFSLPPELTSRRKGIITYIQLLLVVVLFLTTYQKEVLSAIPGMQIVGDPNIREAVFSGLLIIDGFIRLIKMIILCWMILFLALLKNKNQKMLTTEEGLCCLLMVLGSMLAVSSDDFLLMFLSLEMQSIAIVLFIKLDHEANPEIPFKLFAVYSVGTGLFLLGCALLYSTMGTTDCSLIVSYLLEKKPTFKNFTPFPLVAFLLIMLGLFVKMLFIPFQGIYVQVVEKSKIHVFVILNFLPRFVGLILIMRMFAIFNLEHFKGILWAFGLIGMAIGFLNALNQNQIKNMFACDAIGNTGVLLIGFATSYFNIIPCMLFFMVVETLTTLIYFGNMNYIGSYGRRISTLNDLCFIKYESPLAAMVFGIVTFCFIGIPPFPGFLPLVVLAKNMIWDESYLTLLVVFSFKLVSVGNGVRILNALFVKNAFTSITDLQIKKQKKWSSRVLILFALCGLLLLCFFKADLLLNVFVMAETALRAYGD